MLQKHANGLMTGASHTLEAALGVDVSHQWSPQQKAAGMITNSSGAGPPRGEPHSDWSRQADGRRPPPLELR